MPRLIADEHGVHAPQQVVGRRHQRDLPPLGAAVQDPLEIRPDRRGSIDPLPGRFHEVFASRGRALARDVPQPIDPGAGVLAGNQSKVRPGLG